MIVALDTETTGLDFEHGAKPFMVQVCDEGGNQQWWEWQVDPLTRQPKIIKNDLKEIREYIKKQTLSFVKTQNLMLLL